MASASNNDYYTCNRKVNKKELHIPNEDFIMDLIDLINQQNVKGLNIKSLDETKYCDNNGYYCYLNPLKKTKSSSTVTEDQCLHMKGSNIRNLKRDIYGIRQGQSGRVSRSKSIKHSVKYTKDELCNMNQEDLTRLKITHSKCKKDSEIKKGKGDNCPDSIIRYCLSYIMAFKDLFDVYEHAKEDLESLMKGKSKVTNKELVKISLKSIIDLINKKVNPTKKSITVNNNNVNIKPIEIKKKPKRTWKLRTNVSKRATSNNTHKKPKRKTKINRKQLTENNNIKLWKAHFKRKTKLIAKKEIEERKKLEEKQKRNQEKLNKKNKELENKDKIEIDRKKQKKKLTQEVKENKAELKSETNILGQLEEEKKTVMDKLMDFKTKIGKGIKPNSNNHVKISIYIERFQEIDNDIEITMNKIDKLKATIEEMSSKLKGL